MTQRETVAKRYDLAAWYGGMSLVLLLLGGWLTGVGMGPWYRALKFPPFQPPGWAFTPAWIAIFALLAAATWEVARHEGVRRGVALALALYGAQLALNAGWSLLFFAMERPDAALWEILVLDGLLAAMIWAYGRVSRRAGWMLVPYLAWLLFATAINGWIVQANGPWK